MNRKMLIEMLFILDDLVTKQKKKILRFKYENKTLYVTFKNEETIVIDLEEV